jgi:hypothetical protein
MPSLTARPTVAFPADRSSLRANQTADVAMSHRGARDLRLDFWRALCLLDMVLVHLAYEGVNFGPLSRTITDYTRFAAGGYVFLAGLGVGAIFLPRAAASNGRAKVYPSLLRRASYILFVHYVATLSFVALDLIRGMRTDVPPIYTLVFNIVLLREGGDLLPMYVILVAISPLMLEMLRRRFGWLPLATISIALATWGHRSDAALAFPMQQNFPVVLWQMMFVAGMLFGAVLPRYSAMTRRTKLLLAAMAGAMSLLLWASDYRADFGWSRPNLGLLFCKMPLSLGEALRYFGLIFTLIFTTDLMWARLGRSRVCAWCASVGRRSLGSYVAHAWIVGLLGMLAHRYAALGAWQMLLAVPAIAALWGIAQVLGWLASPPSHQRRRQLPRFALPGAAAALSLALVAGVAAVVVRYRGVVVAPMLSQAMVLPDDGDDGDSTDADSPPSAPSTFDLPDTADMVPV